MHCRRERVFVSVICFLLAALLLVMTLGLQIRLRTVESEIKALKSEKLRLEGEERFLSVRLAGRLSLAELERIAVQELGMARCRGDQIVEIRIEEDASAYK